MKNSQAIEKDRVRHACLDRRNSLLADERRQFSDTICDLALRFLQERDLLSGMQVSAYLPIRSEVDLTGLLPALNQHGAEISLPIVLDKTTIIFRKHVPGDPLHVAGFGTSGPPDTAAVVDPTVLLMPLAGFDRQGARIGYGAGHYDRAIDRLIKKGIKPITIGIAFGAQEVARVPSEPHDVPLSSIITEAGIIELKDVKS